MTGISLPDRHPGRRAYHRCLRSAGLQDHPLSGDLPLANAVTASLSALILSMKVRAMISDRRRARLDD